MSESERLIQGWKLRLCSDFPFPFEFLYTLSILPSCLTRPAPFRSLSEAADLSASLHPQYNRQIFQKQTGGQHGRESVLNGCLFMKTLSENLLKNNGFVFDRVKVTVYDWTIHKERHSKGVREVKFLTPFRVQGLYVEGEFP